MRAPMRPELKRSESDAKDFPSVDFDPRLGGPLPEEDLSAPPIDAPAAPTEDTVQAYLEACVKEGVQVTVGKLKRMKSGLRNPTTGKIQRARLVGSVIALQLEGFKRHEIASLLGITPFTVSQVFREVREKASVPDLLRRLDEETLPIAADNIHQAVVNGDLRLSQKLMEGRGLYRTHKSIDSQVTKTEIKISIVSTRPKHLADGLPLPQVKAGAIVCGSPLIDAERHKTIDVVPVRVDDATKA